jgi:hypothetical protein
MGGTNVGSIKGGGDWDLVLPRWAWRYAVAELRAVANLLEAEINAVTRESCGQPEEDDPDGEPKLAWERTCRFVPGSDRDNDLIGLMFSKAFDWRHRREIVEASVRSCLGTGYEDGSTEEAFLSRLEDQWRRTMDGEYGLDADGSPAKDRPFCENCHREFLDNRSPSLVGQPRIGCPTCAPTDDEESRELELYGLEGVQRSRERRAANALFLATVAYPGHQPVPSPPFLATAPHEQKLVAAPSFVVTIGYRDRYYGLYFLRVPWAIGRPPTPEDEYSQFLSDTLTYWSLEHPLD